MVVAMGAVSRMANSAVNAKNENDGINVNSRSNNLHSSKIARKCERINRYLDLPYNDLRELSVSPVSSPTPAGTISVVWWYGSEAGVGRSF